MVKLFNPTGWTIEGKAAGQEYKVPAFSEVEVYDLHHAQHLLQGYKYLGLVSLEFGPKAQNTFKGFEDYKRYQEVAGLKEVLKFKSQCLETERQAEREVKANQGGEGYRSMLNIPRFEKEVGLIETWIKEAGGLVTKKEDLPVVEKRPEWGKVNEPRRDENSGKAAAR